MALLLAVMLASDGKRPVDMSDSFLTMQTLYYFADGGLLLIAGIGYLKMRRGMGRWLGTGEACFSLLFFGYVLGYTLGQGAPFMFSALQQLVYPGITLVLLNWVFCENLVN